MKTGDKVTRKWKPALGVGQVMHILGDNIVVKWTHTDMPTLNVEEKKYLKIVNESR